MPLTQQQIELIKDSVPALKAHGNEVTKTFYSNLLTDNPSLKEIFNTSNQTKQHQPRALAAAVCAYASHIDDLSTLGSTVELITNKHASLHVQPEQYVVVGKYLLTAMKEVLGDALTPELLEAWRAAYGQLADILIKKEDDLYKHTHDWTDWRDFRIKRKVKESEAITSFYLEPVDENYKPLPQFLPGQYISIQMDVPTLGHRQARQYSLSDASWPDYYRVSIKRETGLNPMDPDAVTHPGLISNMMHDMKKEGDIVRVSHPMGDFFLNPKTEDDEGPVVLLSAGVGLTCLMSILNTLIALHSNRQISWIYGARSTDARAFGKHIKEIRRTHDNMNIVLFNAKPTDRDVKGIDYHHEGRIDVDKLNKENDLFLADKGTQYYVCGPTQFMVNMGSVLRGHGVDASRIHMEKFGTGGVPTECEV